MPFLLESAGVIVSVTHPGESTPHRPESESTSTSSGTSEPHPMRSVHTSNFAPILAQMGASVLVTTYQAGRLVILRDDGGVLNTHFRMFPKPMGMALKSASSTMFPQFRASWTRMENMMSACCPVPFMQRETFRFMKWLGSMTKSGS